MYICLSMYKYIYIYLCDISMMSLYVLYVYIFVIYLKPMVSFGRMLARICTYIYIYQTIMTYIYIYMYGYIINVFEQEKMHYI